MRTNRAAIVDYGISNMFSVKRACEHIGIDCVITSDPDEVRRSSAVILPGVGAFGDAMNNLTKLGLIGPMKEGIAAGKPFLGICLGMQLLLDGSEEFGAHKGFGVIKGNVLKFPGTNKVGGKVKVPHIGWSKIRFEGPSDRRWPVLKNVEDGDYMYFIHSYFVEPSDSQNIIATTDYAGITYCSGLRMRNVIAFQFHPEKSGERGMQIYRNFKDMIDKGVE